LFKAVEIPVIEREATAAERLAKGKGGTGNQAGHAEGGGESANPFGLPGTEGTVQPDHGAGLEL
jgi:hypothetical protein